MSLSLSDTMQLHSASVLIHSVIILLLVLWVPTGGALRLKRNRVHFVLGRKSKTGNSRVDSREEDVPILDALEDVLRYSNGAIVPIRRLSASRSAFKSSLDEFFNSIPTLQKARRIKQGRYAESFDEEYKYLANMSFMEGAKKMSSRHDENFERDMDSWLLLSFIQTDMLKVLRLREVSLQMFHEGRSSRSLAGVQGFTPDYKNNQVRREKVQGHVWVGLSMITFCNLLGALGVAAHAVAETLKHSRAVHGIATGLSSAQLADSLKQLALHVAQYGNYAISAGTYTGMALAIADKMAGEEARALVRAGPMNVLAYWPDTELGHMYVGYTAVNNILHSTLGEFNSRPVVVSKILVDEEVSNDEVSLSKNALLGSTIKFGPLVRANGEVDGEDAELVRIVWRKRDTGSYASAWVEPEDIATKARYTATDKLLIYESYEGLPHCTSTSEYIYPGEIFYIAAKDCRRCGIERGECLWKLADGRGWVHQDGCGVISDPMGSEEQLEEELEEKNLLGNRTAGKLRNINLSTGATIVRVLTYTVLGIATVAFALASLPATAVAFIGGSVLGFLAGILPVLKGLAILSSLFTAFDAAASAAVNVGALETIASRAFLAQAALAHWERYLWEVEDCDITESQFCTSGMICLRGGAFFRRSQFSPRGRCIPGHGNLAGGKCLIHKDCATGYCHSASERIFKARSTNSTEEDVVEALLGDCRRACKLGSGSCRPIGPKHMFGVASTPEQRHSQADPVYVLGQTVEVLRSRTNTWELATVTGTLPMITPSKPDGSLEITYSTDSGTKTIHHLQLASLVKPVKAKAEDGTTSARYPVDDGVRQRVEVQASQSNFKFIRRDGSVLTGGTLMEAHMTSMEATAKCKELRGCKGFTYQGSASSTRAHIYFKDSWDMQSPAAWTSYQAIEAIGVPDGPRWRENGINITGGHTNLIAAFPKPEVCSRQNHLRVGVISP